jgi:hypothetical protein
MPRKHGYKSRSLKSRKLRRTKTRRTKTRRTKTRRNKVQRKYYMIGCNKKCKCSCHHLGGSSPIGGLEFKGGGCFGPLVGTPYSANTGGNYYNLPESEAYDVGQNMKLRGGGIIPSNLANFGNNISYGAQSLYNGLAGYKSPTDPSPYVQNKI